MHPIVGLLILMSVATFVVFAFRQGMRVRRDDRPDRSGAYGGDSQVGGSHHDGGLGHG